MDKKFSVISILAIFALLGFSFAQDPFIELNPYGSDTGSNAASWGDFNSDGFEDIYFTNSSDFFGAQNYFYINNGDDTFTKITTGTPVTDSHASGGATWGDFDNDGDLDLLVATNQPLFGGSANNKLYVNNGNGTFTSSTTAGDLIDDSIPSASAGWGDYDNDGHLDAFVTNAGSSAGANSLYQNDGDATFTAVTGIDLVSTANATAIAGFAWGDYDGDGDLDLFVASGDVAYENSLWKNGGGNTFTKVRTFDVNTTLGGCWADYDNDGDLDLYVSNYGLDANTPSANSLYRNDGNDVFTALTSTVAGDAVSDAAFTRASTWGDIDNDGDLDLFVCGDGAPEDGYRNFLYINNGSGYFHKNTTSVAALSAWGYGAVMADYNRDGFLDIQTWRPDENFLYKNVESVSNGNTNSWIVIKLVGVTSNRTGIGAKVKVNATINSAVVEQMREISAQTGFGGHNSLNAHFGLGDASTISKITVEWPSGINQTLNNVGVNQYLTITETEEEAGTIGDVNDDSFSNSTDALIILSCDVGLDVTTFCPMNCGDVNDDGFINSTDALIIQSYDVGLEVNFPVGESGCFTNVTPCPGCNP